MPTTTSAKEYVTLFTGTLLSAFLFFFGASLALLAFFPGLVTGFIDTTPRYTLLPLAENRDGAFLEVGPSAGKQLFPTLTAATDSEEGNWIRIPAIDVKVPLVLSASVEDRDVIAALNSGVALYPNGISPGRLGNTFIAAHSTGNPWQGPYRFAFLKINQLEAGNLIHLDYQGTRYTYRITEKNIIKPTPDYRLASDRPIPTVTLMACWPLWQVSHRMLVTGELVNITKLTPQPA